MCRSTEPGDKASVHILGQFFRQHCLSDFMRTPTHTEIPHYPSQLTKLCSFEPFILEMIVPEMVLVPPPFQVEVMLEPCMHEGSR